MSDVSEIASPSPLGIVISTRTLFVATFVGNPPMNIMDVILQKENGKLFMKLSEGLTLEVPPERSPKVIPERVKMGIRPQDLEIGDKEGVAVSLNNIGQIYHNTGDISRGLEYYHKSLKIHEETGDKNEAALTLNNIGTIYNSQNDFNMALKYFHFPMPVLRRINMNLAELYLNRYLYRDKQNRIT